MRPFGPILTIVLAVSAATVGLALWPTGMGSPDPELDQMDPRTERPNPGQAALRMADQDGERDPASATPPAGRREGRSNAANAAADLPNRQAHTTLGVRAPASAHPLIRVRPRQRVAIRTKPGGGQVAGVVGRRTEFGSPTVFGVVRMVAGWAGVSTPFLSNDELGWVRLDRRKLESGWTWRSIEVSLSERRAVLRHGERELRAFDVTVGAPRSETPTGRFAVTDAIRGGLNPVYGCCALALSATQPDLPPGWLGGNRIAIHGNGSGGPLGTAASNGCLRAADRHVSALVDAVGLGAPVFIRR